jgi:hypothetical protein
MARKEIDEKQLLFDCLVWESSSLKDIATNELMESKLNQKSRVLERSSLKDIATNELMESKLNQKSRVLERLQRENSVRKMWERRAERALYKSGVTSEGSLRHLEKLRYGIVPSGKAANKRPELSGGQSVTFELKQMEAGIDEVARKEYDTKAGVNPVLLSHFGKEFTQAYKLLEGIPDQDNLAASAQRISKAYNKDFETVAIGVMQLGADITDKLANHAERFGNTANDCFNCLVDNYERAVTIENTTYLLSGRLCDKVKENPTGLGLLTDRDAYRLIALGEGIENVVRSDLREGAGGLQIPGVVFVDLMETEADWSALAAYRQDRRVHGKLEKNILQGNYGRKDNPLRAVENVQMHDSDK